VFPELRQALRQLRKSPGFTVTAILTLALGIGATTAIFTLVQQVMLRSLPVVEKPEDLYRIGAKVRCCNWGGYSQEKEFSLFSWELYQRFRDNTPGFTDLAAIEAGNSPLGVRRTGTSQQAETRNGQFVSGNFFRTMGVGALLGRTLNQSDDQEGAPPVAVMSYHVWQEKYGSDPSVVGAGYTVNGHPFTIVGITPLGFYGAKLEGWGMPDIWMPLTKEPLIDGVTERLHGVNRNWLQLIGRIRPGTNPRALQAQLQLELHQWLESHLPDMGPQEKQIWQNQTLHLVSGAAGFAVMREDYEQGLTLLLAAAACVLLVACANLANLLLARGLKNRQQTAVRVALGAPRGKLVRKALVESITLGLMGGAAGVLVAWGGSRLMLHLAFSSQTWVPVEANPSWPVLLFTLVLALATGIIFGIAPAWMTSHADPVEALRGANRTVGSGSHWPQKTLVIAQAAISLVLLSAAAMLGQSLRNLENQKFGFDTDNRYIAWINPLLGGYSVEQLEPLFEHIQERLAEIPGVRADAPVLYGPMTGDSWNDSIRVEGKPEPPPNEDDSSGMTRVMPGFFDVVGDPVAMGRPILRSDSATTQRVAVINEAFAKKFFPGENPVGKHFGPSKMKYAGMFVVVGVAANMRYMTSDYDKAIGPMYFLPEAQSSNFDDPTFVSGDNWSHYLYNIILLAPGHPPNLEDQVRRALGEIDPNLVLYGVDSYTQHVHDDFMQQNMIATLTLLFGGLALLLAAVGLYGVTAYTVEQRTSEIGVRMALGADRNRVVQMVLRGAFWQVGIGLALGIPAAIGAGKLIADQLFGVKPWDPLMLGAATVLLGLAAFLASVIPARRAASLDPVVALRNE